MLSALATKCDVAGHLDASVPLVLPLIEADLFGQIAEAKEAANFAAAYKEAKRCRAYEAYQLLASAVTFSPDSMEDLLLLVRARLASASSPAVRGKLQQLLQHAARGVAANATARGPELAAFVARLLEGTVSREEAARARAKAAVGAATSVAPKERAAAAAASDEERAALHEHLLTEFGLTVLQGALKAPRGALSARDPETLALLEPLLPLLVRALAGRNSSAVALALRVLSGLVALPIPGMAAAAPAAGKALTALLKKAPDARHPVAQDCFRLLAGLLRECPSYSPSGPQLRFLLRWVAADLAAPGAAAAGGGEGGAAFQLLRAVLGRRLMAPEVYDAMDRVQEAMVRCAHCVLFPVSQPIRVCVFGRAR